jgi:ribosomal protein L11 methyltransferase
VIRVARLAVPPADAELAADRLWNAGARAIEEADDPDHPERVVLRTVLAGDDAVSRSRLGSLPAAWELSFHDQDEAPAETWRDFATPIEVSPTLTIRPAWLAPTGNAGPDVAIEPGGAFGLGDHPTTRLSAAAIERLTAIPPANMLDVGCGTGVLAIVAALRGVRNVVAIDIAEAAREATRANAARNGVAGAIVASTAPLSAVEGEFELVVANILAPTLVTLAGELRRCVAPTGALVISGVLAGRYDHVLAALEPLCPVRTDELHGWAAVELRHPA